MQIRKTKEEIRDTAAARGRDIERDFRNEVDRLLLSGAVDLDDVHLGILFGVALENLADNYLRGDRKTARYRNLRKF